MKHTLGRLRKAVTDYTMIDANELVCVAVSGGKDSMLLLKAMKMFSGFSDVPFDVHAVCIDSGFGNMDFDVLREYCESLCVPLTIRKTDIAKIVFDIRVESNPCALCAKLRRGALHRLVKELGSQKLALGHHADDMLETFFLSLLYEGRVNTFKAVTYLDRQQITTIRPLIYMREKDIVHEVKQSGIPVIKSTCPADGMTKRKEVKELIKRLGLDIKESDERMIHAVRAYMNTLSGKNDND